MNNDKRFFIKFTKKDDDQRIVEGYASSEALDSQGEVVKITAIEKALPDYMKFANIRQMHQWSAVGKAISVNIDKAKKGLYLTAKIVDKEAWEKCKEGVYNGFSIGGKVLKRVNNVIEELSLNEISLVDRPANPEAVFAMVKLNKDGVMMETQTATDQPQEEDESVFVARYILDLAADIRMLLNKFQQEGKSIVELNKALTALKALAIKVLSEENHKKFEKILYSADPQELTIKQDFRIEIKEEVKDIKNFVDHNWTAGYFDNLKKVI